jgi:hypothetical protein
VSVPACAYDCVSFLLSVVCQCSGLPIASQYLSSLPSFIPPAQNYLCCAVLCFNAGSGAALGPPPEGFDPEGLEGLFSNFI